MLRMRLVTAYGRCFHDHSSVVVHQVAACILSEMLCFTAASNAICLQSAISACMLPVVTNCDKFVEREIVVQGSS
jgi:hypothetical protein